MTASIRSASTRRTLLLAGAGMAVATPGAARAIMARPEEPVAVPDLAGLVGKSLRVVKPGQPVTMDFSPDRLTLEVDDANRIVSARFG